jgi:hypothetical protein
MIGDIERTIRILDCGIATEEERSRVSNPFDAAYPLIRCSPARIFKTGHKTNNATKPNDAWWRCLKSGQRNPPVAICPHRPCQGSSGLE